MKFQLLSFIVLTIIFVIATSSISSSYATDSCMNTTVSDIWMSFEDIYTGKVVSILNQTEYITDNRSLDEWEKKVDVRINFELESILKGNPPTTWYDNVPFESYCSELCVTGADYYAIGSEIFFIEKPNDGNYALSCDVMVSGEVKVGPYVGKYFDYYKRINGEPVKNIHGEPVEKIYWRGIIHSELSKYTNLRGESVFVFYSSVEKLLERGYLVR